MDPWAEFKTHFDTDDGSIPCIDINGLTGPQVIEFYAFLRSISDGVEDNSPPAGLWHIKQHAFLPLDSVPNAAALMVTGESEHFHFMLSIRFHGVVLPAIGMFVFPDAIGLDYRMGPEWTRTEMEAFLDRWRVLRRSEPNSGIGLYKLKEPEAVKESWGANRNNL